MSVNSLDSIPKHLVHVDDSRPGYTRKKWGRGFSYFDVNRERLKQKEALKRIHSLVIPPNWKNVWICVDSSGHLQCTGYDARARKQYLYHPDWTEYRQREKFSKVLSFGRVLPEIRKKVDADLALSSWPKQKVLALAVHLLDDYYLRIGNSAYVKKNETYGLTTLRRKHLNFRDESFLKLSYQAKSNKERNIAIRDKMLIRMIRETSELRGYEVFRYLDSDNQSCSIDSSDVNTYIHEIGGDAFTAKDFRTWAGTKLAVEFALSAFEEADNHPTRKRIPTLVKQVAKRLGNTQKVCRTYYIHPAILSKLEADGTDWIARFSDADPYLNACELAVIDVLQNVK